MSIQDEINNEHFDTVTELQQQLAAANKEIGLLFGYAAFLHKCCLSGEEPKSYEWFCEIEKAAEKLHKDVFGEQKGGNDD